MSYVYALDSIVDEVGGVRIGRLVYRYTRVTERTALDPARVNRVMHRIYVGPHREYWLGLEDVKPAFVRIQWTNGRLGDRVFRWQRNRVSWDDARPLPCIGVMCGNELQLLGRNEGASRRVLELESKVLQRARQRRAEQGQGGGAPAGGGDAQRDAEGLAGGPAARAA